MSRPHTHDHGGSHAHGSNETALALAAGLTGTFMVAEVVGGAVSGSLALIADAGHMLTDFASLLLAWFAFRLARRPADWKRSYGFDRFSILAAFVNGLSLFVIAGWILFEAVRRLMNPPDVLGELMLGVAVAGLAVNIAAFWILTRGQSDNLNIRAAALHVMGDLLGSVAAIAASVVILATGWMPIDPLLSVLVAALILRSAYKVVAESGHILLEGTPRDIKPGDLALDLGNTVAGVERVRHVHIWSITQERRMATLEAVLLPDGDPYTVKSAIKQRLAERYDIHHATVETI